MHMIAVSVAHMVIWFIGMIIIIIEYTALYYSAKLRGARKEHPASEEKESWDGVAHSG